MEANFFNTTGKRVRILREDRNLKQVELAQELERHGASVGSPQISKIEADMAMPSPEVLVALVRALDTTADYLLLLSDDPRRAAEEASERYISPEADELARLADSMPAETRGELLAMARRLARPGTGRAEREREALWWLSRVEQAAGLPARQALERLIMSGDDPSGD